MTESGRDGAGQRSGHPERRWWLRRAALSGAVALLVFAVITVAGVGKSEHTSVEKYGGAVPKQTATPSQSRPTTTPLSPTTASTGTPGAASTASPSPEVHNGRDSDTVTTNWPRNSGS
ncbi:hypothetical protein [Amycolatopsis sp.]|uniref:hypothetical protein n=1 Tax=Amycolatopsis sp. TaxID=37632 RepID=UPI002C7879C3|nr:hypothetical protein [Amycolatopsis sp.]HVV12020.1 hypothetical protein [Amycolatopsis sp.]